MAKWEERRADSDIHGRNLLLWLLVLLAAAAAPLRACWAPERESVHFNWFRPDFFRMPRPWPGSPPGPRAPEPSPFSQDDRDTDYKPPEISERVIADRALRDEAAGKFRPAAAEWERLVNLARSDPDPQDRAQNTRSQLQGLRERIMALHEWRSPSDTASLRAVLRARDLLNAGHYGEVETALHSIFGGPYLRHAEYLRACVPFYHGSEANGAAAFRSLARRRPSDPLVLYMIARCLFRPAARDAQRQAEALDDPQRKYVPIPKDVRTSLEGALRAYLACAAVDRHGALGRDAEEMAAACRYRLGERTWPLLLYCRRLGTLHPGQENWPMWVSARNCLRAMNTEDHRAFQKLAVKDAPAAGAYLDLILQYDIHSTEALGRLGRFALEVSRRSPSTPLSASILARLAAIENRNGHPERAKRLARASLRRGATGLSRDEARWQHALALRASGLYAAALREYEALAENASVPHFRRGAREAAAVLHERRGDYVEALRDYFALDYHPDYAYLLDCLAPDRALEQFLRRYPHHPQARLVRYSLGFRQFRRGEYDQAEHTFSRLGTWLAIAERKYRCETEYGTPRTPPRQAAWILAAADRSEEQAKTPKEKARAAYAGARFLFRQRSLLFYNGALWQGSRILNLDLDGPYNIQTRKAKLSHREWALRSRYEEEHAALLHALHRFQRIARDFPDTPEAPRALATAALCYLRLPVLGTYWSRRERPIANNRAAGCFRELLRKYPHDPLAKTAAAYVGARDAR